MTFLEARRILAAFSGGPSLPIRLSASGNVEPLLLYIQAAAATMGRCAEVGTLPFGTLGQALRRGRPDEREVVLLLPWDFVPECDWRSGIPVEIPCPARLLAATPSLVGLLERRGSALLYLPAPIPPIYADPAACASLHNAISGLAAGLGAAFLAPSSFALGSYLASGAPVAGARAGDVAEAVVRATALAIDGRSKVLATDLDNVLWAGLAAEDGPDGIQCGAEGVGFRHFLYQGLLARLKASGVLLAAVSRNDLDVVRAPIKSGRTLLSERDFVGILASFEPKSVQIARLADSLNLSLDAFVFIDDNPVELAEVGAALPDVTCLPFPSHDDQLPAFLHEVARLFARRAVTDEDKQRTEMYRRQVAVAGPVSAVGTGADLTDFLATLRMELTICDRTGGSRERAIQLINKTNQFNLNGRRLADEDVVRMLAEGGRLYTARLDDRSGTHGEIMVCLLDRERRIVSLVLSCRVFQRFVEHAFLCWLVGRFGNDVTLAYAPTERNTPLREFLKDPAFSRHGVDIRLDRARFLEQHQSRLGLFTMKEEVER